MNHRFHSGTTWTRIFLTEALSFTPAREAAFREARTMRFCCVLLIFRAILKMLSLPPEKLHAEERAS